MRCSHRTRHYIYTVVKYSVGIVDQTVSSECPFEFTILKVSYVNPPPKKFNQYKMNKNKSNFLELNRNVTQ